ncbi:MAG: hypothetical protein ACYDA5_05225 [Vulcanimicrobiaceae bacterium]
MSDHERALCAALAQRPQIARTLVAHLASIFDAGTVARRTKELCAVMVARLNACTY